jgi:hypothetical protein
VNDGASSQAKLSIEQVYALCGELIRICDGAYDYCEQLKASGFSAFQPYEAFFQSFAETPDGSDLHRRIHVEKAKETLGRPWPPLYIRPEYRRPLFKSRLLEELRAKRDAKNGVSENDLEKRYSRRESFWRRTIDPCDRRSALLEITDKELYDARWSAVFDSMSLQVQEEALHFATELSKIHTFDKDGRYALFRAVMEREAAPLGFCYDKRKSRPGFPIFSKAITDGWDLCWAIEEPDMFFWNPFGGRFMPFLELRHRDLRGGVKDNAEPGEFLQLRYTAVVSGFFNAYRTFRGADELETMIKAHLSLYGLMAPSIESGIAKALKKRQLDG